MSILTWRFGRWAGWLVCVQAAALVVPALAAAAPAATVVTKPDDVKFFDEQVRPILESSCIKCHGGEKTKGNLKLTSRETILKGGDTAPAVSVDNPDKSLILDAINYRNDLEMPPKGKLPQASIDLLTKWVKLGAPWKPGMDLAAAHGAVATTTQPAHAGPPSIEEAKSFWSFQPVKRPAVPGVKQKDWVRNPIDAFVLAKLESKNLGPAPAADKVALLRRAYYDLTGLPPSPKDVDAFLADASPDAYEKVVDRLLASPHYGEKWGRHWLDLVRFAETNSYERDNPKPNAWRYRDYVIKSFNDDKPYDRFLKEQLAGDEMPEAKADPEPIIATGFYRLGIWDDEPSDREQARYDTLDDIVATTGQVFLGMTVDCARCHDHKIDPIPQTDYYKLVAFFRNINHFRNGGMTDELPLPRTGQSLEQAAVRAREREKRRHDAEAAVNEVHGIFHQLVKGEPGRGEVKLEEVPRLIRAEGARVLGAERFAEYRRMRRELESLGQPDAGQDMALCVTERGPTAPDTFVLIRGNASSPSQKVDPGFLKVLGTPDPLIPKPAPGAKSTGRRTVLANWIASKENPLTARVMANRIWQYHFGRGIVRSTNNFGIQGEKPTHPELLDWLAAEFTTPSIGSGQALSTSSGQGGWHMKAMHRLIMTSNAYRMSSKGDPKALALDPQNDLMWRFDLRRLTAEEIRDSILAVNGTLNPKMYGPSVYPPIPAEVMAGQSMPGKGWNTSGPEDSARRSVYIHVKRSLRVPIIEAFDAAETDKSCPVRFVTVQPTQALGMINGSFMNGEAEKLAKRIRKEAGDDVRKQVAYALRLATCHTPTEAEVSRGLKLIDGLQKQDAASADAAMKYFCLVVLNLNEFVYVD